MQDLHLRALKNRCFVRFRLTVCLLEQALEHFSMLEEAWLESIALKKIFLSS